MSKYTKLWGARQRYEMEMKFRDSDEKHGRAVTIDRAIYDKWRALDNAIAKEAARESRVFIVVYPLCCLAAGCVITLLMYLFHGGAPLGWPALVIFPFCFGGIFFIAIVMVGAAICEWAKLTRSIRGGRIPDPLTKEEADQVYQELVESNKD